MSGVDEDGEASRNDAWNEQYRKRWYWLCLKLSYGSDATRSSPVACGVRNM